MLIHQLNITSIPWSTSLGKEIKLKKDDIHIWHLPLIISHGIYQHLQYLLSPNELSIAKRYHFEKDCISFSVRRAFLRILLGHYTGIRPEHIRFSYNGYGKPELGNNKCSIAFNVSFSYDNALYAISRDRNIGVDIEKVRPIHEMESIAEHFFSLQERTYFTFHAGEDKLAAFFVLWTRLEAFLKARGVGLSSQGKGQANIMQWHYWSFSPKSEYIACLASYQQNMNIQCFDWGNFCDFLS